MKRFLMVLVLLITTVVLQVNAITVETNVNMKNYWKKNGKDAEKVISVAKVLINKNNLKRVPIHVQRKPNSIETKTDMKTKRIYIASGLLPYLDNDDELAYILGHELAHAQELYDSPLKVIAMQYNNRKYQYKADLCSIDYMVTAGYNPIAAILAGDKIFHEPMFDWGNTYLHPKGSKRLLAMYKYIYKKYPTYLNSDMAKTDSFKNFMEIYSAEISAFEQKQIYKINRQSL